MKKYKNNIIQSHTQMLLNLSSAVSSVHQETNNIGVLRLTKLEIAALAWSIAFWMNANQL